MSEEVNRYLNLSPELGQVVYHFAIGYPGFRSAPAEVEKQWSEAFLVHGNNHFILSGPVPDEAVALALARHWSIIQIGETKIFFFRPVGDSVKRISRESGMGCHRAGRP